MMKWILALESNRNFKNVFGIHQTWFQYFIQFEFFSIISEKNRQRIYKSIGINLSLHTLHYIYIYALHTYITYTHVSHTFTVNMTYIHHTYKCVSKLLGEK